MAPRSSLVGSHRQSRPLRLRRGSWEASRVSPEYVGDNHLTATHSTYTNIHPPAGGRISLVAQDDSYETMIGISYKNGKPPPRPNLTHYPLTPPQTPAPNPTSPP